METVTIKGKKVKAVSPEGVVATLKLADVLDAVAPRGIDTFDVVLPDGVKAVLPGKNGVIVVHQTPPRVCGLRWIAKDSGELFGPGTDYMEVRVALPYLVVLAYFERSAAGRLCLSNTNECFFRNHPLKSLSDELLYPGLLNCSRFDSHAGRPLSWICTAKLDRRPLAREPDPSRRIERSLKALLGHLRETGFNLSSEHHEGGSWWGATVEAEVDPRVASIEAWQEATRADPLFALEVPWLRTGMSVGEIVTRMTTLQKGGRAPIATSGDLARIVFNRRRGGSGKAES